LYVDARVATLRVAQFPDDDDDDDGLRQAAGLRGAARFRGSRSRGKEDRRRDQAVCRRSAALSVRPVPSTPQSELMQGGVGLAGGAVLCRAGAGQPPIFNCHICFLQPPTDRPGRPADAHSGHRPRRHRRKRVI